MKSAITLYFLLSFTSGWSQSNKIDLSGSWRFATDPGDKGKEEKWYNKKLGDQLVLPGSMTTNNKGDEVRVDNPWTGSIWDSSWFFNPKYAKYRQPGNIKIPFWLQPVKHYKGAAWYQKTITIPEAWQGKQVELFIERAHWETTVWIDSIGIGMQNSLGTPHVYYTVLKPGSHELTICVDNRVKDFNVGQNSHSISDHTQSNWNGMVGELSLRAKSTTSIEDVRIFPDIKNKQAVVKIKLQKNGVGDKGVVEIFSSSTNPGAEKLQTIKKEIDGLSMEIVYPMGKNPLLWDEFAPNLYTMQVKVGEDIKKISFGMRDWAAKGTQFNINGKLVFLRGTLECAIFPRTGFPPTDVKSWSDIFKVCKSYGLNHVRFHSWTPPGAAFIAADQAGIYLQVECSSWANQGASIGDGEPLDKYIYDESERVVKTYGNHPSFVMMSYGNEPHGKNHVEYLKKFVQYWKEKDQRRSYTAGAGWPAMTESDYNNSPEPRIEHWQQGLNSIINSQPPRTDYDWRDTIKKWDQPTVSHEIGQWCVYPDFKEITQYSGVLKAKNFEIFRDQLKENGLVHLADSFLLASGKLQVLCYKADIEAALRTPGFGGFQLLDLHDFPGQGTALVGVLNPFWKEKGYVTGKEYSRFSNRVVPLARFAKMVWLNSEALYVPVEIAQFSGQTMQQVSASWTITDEKGAVIFTGKFSTKDILQGNAQSLGEIKQSLQSINKPQRLVLTVHTGKYSNNWDFFVYPANLPAASGMVVTDKLDDIAVDQLNNGGKVLLTLKKGSLDPAKGGNIKIGFSSIFWNTAWTSQQPPTTLGILCNPSHPALKEFPTQYHSNYQWWDGMTHSNVIIADSITTGLKPIVRVIDDWVTARSLGLIFECKVGKGELIISGIDLITNADKRSEARQLLHSLQQYMMSSKFSPSLTVPIEKIKTLTVN